MNERIFCCYRDNALFREYVPRLVEGMNTETYVIPEGTVFDEKAKADLTAAADAAVWSGCRSLITDRTCADVAICKCPDAQLGLSGVRFRRYCFLDDVFSQTIERWQPQNSMADNFAWLSEHVVAGCTIQSVVIVRDNIGDHSSNDPESIANWVRDQSLRLFPKARVSIVKTLHEAMVAATPVTLIIADRHCGIKELMDESCGWYHNLANWPGPGYLMQLPFETCAENLVSVGRISFSFDISEMRKILDEMDWK